MANRRKKKRKIFSPIYLTLVLIILYLPILMVIIYSFNSGRTIGAWQGFWIAYVGIPPFICTLSGMLVFRGLCLLILNGMTLAPFP